MKNYVKIIKGEINMAGTITHAYFALDLYERLSIRSKELLMDKKEDLKLFAQNTDVLFFYNITNFKKGKKTRDFGINSQKVKVYEFFSTLVNYIKYNNHHYNPQVMAYLYGMISHYVLDSTVHPFIIYKTGNFDKKNKETYKYNHLHNEIESYLDNYMIKIREGINPQKFKCYNYCFNVDILNNDLIEVMDFTYKEVFGIKDFHKYYVKSYKQMKFFYRLFRYDPIGYKKVFYHLVDLISPKYFLRKVPLSYHISEKGKKKFLNLEHKRWYNPTDKRTKSNESYIELYTKALSKTTEMIKQINQYIYYDKKIDLKKVIGNLSYETGKDCDIKRELKFFEF